MSSHLVAPATATGVSAKIAAVRAALVENLLPDTDIADDGRGRDVGFIVRGARVDEVARAVAGLAVAVEPLGGRVLVWFRA